MSKSGINISAVEVVKPNLKKQYKILNALQILCMVIGIGGLIGFVLGGVFMVKTVGGISYAAIIVPFFCSPLGMILTSIILARKNAVKVVMQTVEKIQSFDKILLVQLFDNPDAMNVENILLVQKLIDTQNLIEYDFIDNIILAKKELNMSVSDARAELEKFVEMSNPMQVSFSPLGVNPQAPAPPVMSHCPNCGAAIENNDQFCQYCGVKLKD